MFWLETFAFRDVIPAFPIMDCRNQDGSSLSSALVSFHQEMADRVAPYASCFDLRLLLGGLPLAKISSRVDKAFSPNLIWLYLHLLVA